MFKKTAVLRLFTPTSLSRYAETYGMSYHTTAEVTYYSLREFPMY